jgi:hypothetical protein
MRFTQPDRGTSVARSVLVTVQAATMVGLSVVLFAAGSWRLGMAQVLLALVTGLVYFQ